MNEFLTRSLFKNYSWLDKGEFSKIIKFRYSGRLSLILAVCSGGEYIGMVLRTHETDQIHKTPAHAKLNY